MSFNPNLPANDSPIVAPELRDQFNGLQENIDAKAYDSACVARLNTTALNPLSVQPLNLVVSNPVTQAEVQNLANKVDEMLLALKRIVVLPPP